MTAQNGEVVSVNSFTVIQVKSTRKSKTSRCLYVKENDSTEVHPSKPSGRTLFVLNIPPYATEEGLKQMFSECGTVKQVYLQSKPSCGSPLSDNVVTNDLFARPASLFKGYQVAYVIFKDKPSLQLAMRMPFSRERFMSSDDTPVVSGLQKYRNAYVAAYPPPADVLRAQVKDYMAKYDERVELEKLAVKESEGVPDDDGWITVTRSKGGAPNTEAHDERVKRKLKKRNQEKELLHFYKFQVRESKKEHLTALRKKFEEDKQRIAQLRAARKFRPY